MRLSSARAGQAARAAGRGGFTLIELIAVVTIILILAGLILSVAGYANTKGAAAKAQGEIQAISVALDGYKTDNGAYPESGDTDGLSAKGDIDPGSSASNTKYQKAGETLYQALAGLDNSGNGTITNPDGSKTPIKSYFTFNPSQLPSPQPSQPSATTNLKIYMVDPFGFPYGYSTANLASATPSGTPPGYNPTFDLWSTAGYGTGGKSTPSPTPTPGSLWIKNW